MVLFWASVTGVLVAEAGTPPVRPEALLRRSRPREGWSEWLLPVSAGDRSSRLSRLCLYCLFTTRGQQRAARRPPVLWAGGSGVG